MSYTAFLSLFISMVLLPLTLTLSKKSMSTRKKWSAFECGFNQINKTREPFSMRFFLLAILFIIFDIEIVLIVPLMITCTKTSLLMWSSTSTMFLLILIIGILIEWKEETFSWKI